MDRLRDKVSIITGAGSGIGRGIALRFAEEGSKIVIADLVPEAGQETVELIKSAGGQAFFVETDVAKAADVERLVNLSVGQFGRIDILCNNAGIFTIEVKGALKITDLSEEDWDRIIDVNLKGVFLCSKYTIPEMIKAGGGSIVNISSIAGHMIAFGGAYGASKTGLISLTKSLALQYADDHIRANAICPGAIETSTGANSRTSGIYKHSEFKRVRLIPRLGTPDDIAHCAVYLASEEASYVTAAVFNVDGGTLSLGVKPTQD